MKLILILFSIFGAIKAYEDMTVVEYISRHDGFTTLTTYLHKSGLYETLSGPGLYTVFAATDAAFRKLDFGTRSTLDGDPERLIEVLQYSVVHQFIMTATINGYTDFDTLLHGQYLRIFKNTGGAFVINGTDLHSPMGVICRNGVVQTIHTVLLPPTDTPPLFNIAQTFVRNEKKFRDFTLFMLYYGLLPVLEGGEFTVFAPNDAAFGLLGNIIMNRDLPNPTDNELKDILKYHVIPGARNISRLRDGQQIYTLAYTALTFEVPTNGRVMVDYAHVIESILAANGYIYVIDHLLAPVEVVNHMNSHAGFHTNFSYPIDQTQV